MSANVSVNETLERATAGAQRVSDTALQAARATDSYVRRSPWQAVAVAALAGAAVGYMISRR